MGTESKAARIMRHVLNTDVMKPHLTNDAMRNAHRWRFLGSALDILENRGLLRDPSVDGAPLAAAPKEEPMDTLDPSRVKAGDPVTVRVEEEYAANKYAYTITDTKAYLMTGTGPLMVGPLVLDQKNITILDHRPAPGRAPVTDDSVCDYYAPGRVPRLGHQQDPRDRQECAMGTEIKPGQVWAKDDDHGYEVRVVWASSDSVHYERPTVGESRALAKAFLYEFHLVKDVPPTPAPLDPHTIREGSRILLEDGPEADAGYVGGIVGHVNENGFVIIDHLGTFAVRGLTRTPSEGGYRLYTLAKHTPPQVDALAELIRDRVPVCDPDSVAAAIRERFTVLDLNEMPAFSELMAAVKKAPDSSVDLSDYSASAIVRDLLAALKVAIGGRS